MVDFKVGDLVQLRSGGPVMTIESFGYHRSHPDLAALLYTDDEKPRVEEGKTPSVSCQWFAGEKLQQGEFAPASLVRAENDEGLSDS